MSKTRIRTQEISIKSYRVSEVTDKPLWKRNLYILRTGHIATIVFIFRYLYYYLYENGV